MIDIIKIFLFALGLCFHFNTSRDAALVGCGGIPKPGEILLAHNCVLFLDELPEFKRTVEITWALISIDSTWQYQ